MMCRQHTCTVMLHLYYRGSWQIIQPKIEALLAYTPNFIVTYCKDGMPDEVNLPEAIFLKVPNIGKDIGGKLAAIDHYLRFSAKTEFLVLMHDKISPQTLNADYWIDTLFSIFSNDNWQKVLKVFSREPSVGIIGSAGFLKNEYQKHDNTFDTSNNIILRELIENYRLNCKKFDYIAGTTFAIRSEIYEDFFSANSALEIRSHLEKGNVLDLQQGTFTHSWERLLCFIAEHNNFKVHGV